MKTLLTLTIIQNDTHILLGMKKRGFGAGKWNGFGGHVENGETIEEAAKRELKEEVGLDAANLQKRGILNFEFENKPELLEVHVYVAPAFHGEPVESEEMRPRWFAKDAIPYSAMWADDKHWLPLALGGKKFRGSFYFKDENLVLHHLIEVENP